MTAVSLDTCKRVIGSIFSIIQFLVMVGEKALVQREVW